MPWQRHWHKHPAVRTGDQLTLGEGGSDHMRNSMGSWPFMFGFIATMMAWAVVNSVFYLGGSEGTSTSVYPVNPSRRRRPHSAVHSSSMSSVW